MTPLNTIIEEEKPEDIEKWVRTLAGSSNPRDTDLLVAKINVLRTSAMQRAYEAGKEECDTYWKERVRGMKWETNHVPFATEEQIRKCTCSACKHNQTLDTLLDNLK